MTRTEYELIYDAFKSHRYKMTDAQEVLSERFWMIFSIHTLMRYRNQLNNCHKTRCILAAGILL